MTSLRIRKWGDFFTEGGDGCWEWGGYILPHGYGSKSVGGKNVYTHRLSFTLFNGRDPVGVVRHRCDNRKCYRPDHLEEGTKGQNSADMVKRDHHTRGARNARSKLSVDQVTEIRAAYNSPESRVSIASRYGIHPSTVAKIGKGQRWSDERNFSDKLEN